LHELSLAEGLVAKCAELCRGRRVLAVRARCSAGIDAEELAAVFPVAAKQYPGGELENATFDLEVVPAHLECSCGWAGELPGDNVAGHIGICPGCGRPTELSGGLELLGLGYAGDAGPG
jgi:Zn finger protein HypA/HybF involved in hydrogenase expression